MSIGSRKYKARQHRRRRNCRSSQRGRNICAGGVLAQSFRRATGQGSCEGNMGDRLSSRRGRFEHQRRDHPAPLVGEHVVGAAGGGRVHGFQRQAHGNERLQPGCRDEAVATAAAQQQHFDGRPAACAAGAGASCSARVAKWAGLRSSKRAQFQARRRPSEARMTLWVIFSASTAIQPGP